MSPGRVVPFPRRPPPQPGTTAITRPCCTRRLGRLVEIGPMALVELDCACGAKGAVILDDGGPGMEAT